jgi:hypothetical protein
VLPGLWVVAVEAGSHVIRRQVGLTGPEGVDRMDRVRWSRWLLAPASTLRLRRRMVLWETRSYSEALRRERDRLLACTDLQDRWGRWAWRWRAPRRARVLYRLGELTPAAALPTAPVPDPDPIRRPASRTPRRRPRPSAELGELTDAGRTVAAEMAAEGVPLTRGALADRLRARGMSVSNARLSALLAELRTGTARPTDEGMA